MGQEQPKIDSGKPAADDIEKAKAEAEIVEKVSQMRSSLYARKGKTKEVHEKICAIAEKLKEKYSKATEYRLFHVLIGSTPRVCPNFDFPGDDSIVKILEDLGRKYEEEEQK